MPSEQGQGLETMGLMGCGAEKGGQPFFFNKIRFLWYTLKHWGLDIKREENEIIIIIIIIP